MMEPPLLMIAAMGVATSVVGTLATFKDGFAAGYVRTSIKGRIWRRILGEDRTIFAIRRVFGPFAIGLGVVMTATAVVLSVLA